MNNVVLYAEDDTNDAFFMRRAFKKLKTPFELHLVDNGRGVLDLLRAARPGDRPDERSRPALVLLDVKMPEISGLEVLEWIRAESAFDSMPVIMFTSSAQESDIASARRHGANSYIVKPSNSNHLHLIMERMLAELPKLRGECDLLEMPENLLLSRKET